MQVSVKATRGLCSNQINGAGSQVMLITADRVAYVGLVGKPKMRELGALAVYVSLGVPFQIQIGKGSWESAGMYVVAPDTPHRIETSARLIGVLLIETEAIDFTRLPHWLQPTEGVGEWSHHLADARSSLSALSSGDVDPSHIREDFDQFFFGQPLERRSLDSRLVAVMDKINKEPFDHNGAEECASYIDLSFSRFLHLFKEQVGMTFRKFRAWKRARNFLYYVNAGTSLTHIAFEIGYADSSHFSHTIRRYWGLTARDIVAGSRQLTVVT